MAWQDFRVRKSADPRMPAAALAAIAAIDPENDRSAASAATAARVHAENTSPSAATAASAAGVHAKTENVDGVPPGEVAALYERIVSFLMKDGRARPEAELDALPVLHARLANDPRLMPFTKFSTVCAVCSEGEGNGVPLLPILSSRKGTHIWLHMGECHQQHREAHAQRVEACIVAAGIIAGPKTERAA